MGFIDELQGSIRQAAEPASKAVVGIGSRHRGSGVVVADGRVLTNAHNLRGEEVTIRVAGGRATRGKVLAVDLDGDLAVIDVDTTGASPLDWGDPSQLGLGAPVFAAAATPSGDVRVTFGTVSAVGRAFRGPGGRRISGTIEHTAPLAAGSSGSAILDAAGHLVGLNTNRLGEGFYLAVPADAALRQRIDGLSRGVSPERRRLGVAIAPAFVARRLRRSVGLPERDGVLVRGVEEGSAAETAGIAAGDLIVEVGGRAVADGDELVDAIAAAGETYEVKVVRGAEERVVSVSDAGQQNEQA